MNNIKIIVAVDQGGGFAKDGTIPWNYKEDFAHFKKTTKGAACVMGRHTYEDMAKIITDRGSEINGTKGILPGRTSYVLSRQDNYAAKGAYVRSGLRVVVEEIMKEDKPKKIFVLGGERLFWEALPWVDQIYLTLVPGYHQCDLVFPVEYLQRRFKVDRYRKGKECGFLIYKRK